VNHTFVDTHSAACCRLIFTPCFFELPVWASVFLTTCVWFGFTALRSGEDNSNQWMGVAVASQRSPVGRAVVSDRRLICRDYCCSWSNCCAGITYTGQVRNHSLSKRSHRGKLTVACSYGKPMISKWGRRLGWVWEEKCNPCPVLWSKAWPHEVL